MKCVIKHIANNVYLKRHERLNLNHYTPYLDEATVYDMKGALKMKKRLKHPENFEIKRVSEIEKGNEKN